MSSSFNLYLKKVRVLHYRNLHNTLLAGKKGLFRKLHYVLNFGIKVIRIGVYIYSIVYNKFYV
jgi:hypothetical protein